jgi:hypothetical protein
VPPQPVSCIKRYCQYLALTPPRVVTHDFLTAIPAIHHVVDCPRVFTASPLPQPITNKRYCQYLALTPTLTCA